ncbi:MAG: CPBP family intramembrane metalloprotease [Deltaproteobacteria bacterium]|nr:CPBP family intramembrane metalloprotease [Deltaproteobacteria bacterium]
MSRTPPDALPAAVDRGSGRPDRPPSDTGSAARILLEVGGLWLATLLAIRAVVTAQTALGLHEVVLALVPVLFIYLPVLVCRLRGADSWSYLLWIPALRDRRAWREALVLNLRILGIGIVPWLLAYHVYQTHLFGFSPSWRFPASPLTLVAYHVFFVAIPEEFFYRGYLQTRLNEVFPRRFLLAGIPFGHGLWIAALLFAFGHSLVELRWWHFATFFPGLLFGLLRERTGSVTASALCHAACNILVNVLDTIYGIVPP